MDKYASARYTLLTVCGFTLVNMVLMLFNSNIYFVYSAQIPQYIYVLVYYLTGAGKFISFIIAMVPVALLFLCWYLSEKNNIWMIIATVLYGIDALLAVYGLLSSFSISNLVQALIAVYVMYMLINGLRSSWKFWKIANRKRPKPSDYRANREIIIDVTEDDENNY